MSPASFGIFPLCHDDIRAAAPLHLLDLEDQCASPGFSTDGPTVAHQTSIRIVAVRISLLRHILAVLPFLSLLCGLRSPTEHSRIELFAFCKQYPSYSAHLVSQGNSSFE